MAKEIQPSQGQSPFDAIRRIENGYEYWSARELQELMGYNNWREFDTVVGKAIAACKNVGQEPSNHFGESPKMVTIGSGSQRKIKDYRLTRYGCYLVAMNGDPHKAAVAAAQAYFAIKTHEAELAQQRTQQPSVPPINHLWQKRLALFNERTRIPDGYWCVFNEIAAVCWSLEFQGAHLRADAVPDISVGQMWCKHARHLGLDLSLVRQYPHHYPDRRGVQAANIYPNAWLGAFRDWFQTHYLRHHFPAYLKAHALALPSPEPRR
jgi:hypothetical protein